MLPAAAPPWAVSTLAFSPDVAQPATPALAVALGWGAGADVGVAAGALDTAGGVGDAEPAFVAGVLDELHAAASNTVPSSSVTPSA